MLKTGPAMTGGTRLIGIKFKIIGILAIIAVSNLTKYQEKDKALREGRPVIEKVEPNKQLEKLNIK